MRFFIASLLLTLTFQVNAEIVTESGHTFIYKVKDDFATIKDNAEMAITDRGLLVSGTLHVNDMLQRTAKDLGFPDQAYIQAESLEFCSSLISQRMIKVAAENLTICPFTVSIYVKSEEPDFVYVAFRKQYLSGEEKTAKVVTDDIHKMLKEIATEALDE